MAKDKSLKSKSNPSKQKKLSTDDNQVHAELMEIKVKKKRKYVEAEEAPVQINSATDSPDNRRCKKDKKSKKKKTTGETHTHQPEYPDPSSCSEPRNEPEEEKDLSPEERRVLERKMKKILKKEEKKRLKEEGQTALKPQDAEPRASKQALDYLACWAENRSAWKFQKTRQTWLLQHMFDSEKIPDDKFSVLLQYLEGLCGLAKDTTVGKALSLVEESGKAPSDTDVQQRAQRAREVIQLLS